MNSTAQLALDPQLPRPTGPTHIVSRSTQTRASNVARARLVVANVTPTGYRVGVFMANHARYAKPSDVRRNVVEGEIFCYWPQAKIASELGCSERQIRRGVQSLREAGALDVRQRVRPCEASYVFVQPVLSNVLSDVRSGVRSHTEPRTEPPKEPRTKQPRARVACKKCGHDWPDVWGTKCHECNYDPATENPVDDKPTDDLQPTGNPDGYCGGRIRNCPKCHNGERGYDDSCQHCDWTREAAAIERRATAPKVEPPPNVSPPPKADKDRLMRWYQQEKEKHGKTTGPVPRIPPGVNRGGATEKGHNP